MHIIRREKIFLLIESEITQVKTSISTSAKRRDWVLHLGLPHLNPPSLNSNLTSKRQAWEEHNSAPRDKGVQTQVEESYDNNGL